MAAYRTASQTIAEMREFAGFTAQEQFFIERSLEIVRSGCGADGIGALAEASHSSFTRAQQAAYSELRALRGELRPDQPVEAIEAFFSALVRVTTKDFARGALSSFGAYRFLYERLLGAGVRPWLPASFCAAAALPQIEPARRTLLLESVSEAVVATPCWSEREPLFVPCRVLDEPELGQ